MEIGVQEKQLNTKKLSAELCLYISILSVFLLYRIFVLPSDFGGAWFQCLFGIMGMLYLSFAVSCLKGVPERIARWLCLMLWTLVQIGSLYFAPQSLLPLVLVIFVFATVIIHRDKLGIVVGLVLTTIPLASYCSYGINHIVLVTKIRSLAESEVHELRFINVRDVSSDKTEIVVTDPQVIHKIVIALHDISPYSPNHDGIVEPWFLQVGLLDGSSLEFQIGRGTSANPQTAWIQFGVEVYQSDNLYRLLQEANLKIWSSMPVK